MGMSMMKGRKLVIFSTRLSFCQRGFALCFWNMDIPFRELLKKYPMRPLNKFSKRSIFIDLY